MTQHKLKIWPNEFLKLSRRYRSYEIRKADRDFQVGDEVIFREWDPIAKLYTGRNLRMRIHHLTRAGEWGLPKNLCVFEVQPMVTYL